MPPYAFTIRIALSKRKGLGINESQCKRSWDLTCCNAKTKKLPISDYKSISSEEFCTETSSFPSCALIFSIIEIKKIEIKAEVNECSIELF